MRFFVGFVAVVALVITGCGTDGSERVSANTDASALLRSTFTNLQSLKSGALDLEVSTPDGRASVSGPFERTGEKSLPKFSFVGRMTAGSKSETAGATWTGSEAFAAVDGTTYEIPSLLVKQLEAMLTSQTTPLPDVSKWVAAPHNTGTASVGGVDTVKITGTAKLAQVLADVETFSAPLKLLGGSLPSITPADKQRAADAVKNATVEVYTGADDQQLRRLVVRATVDKAPVVVDLTLTGVGESQSISAPKDARPFSELTAKLAGGDAVGIR